jgi:hypothetical protein
MLRANLELKSSRPGPISPILAFMSDQDRTDAPAAAPTEHVERVEPSRGGPALSEIRFGMQLRKIREDRGMTLAETAKKARMPARLLKAVEAGREMDNFYLDQMVSLAVALDCEIKIGDSRI